MTTREPTGRPGFSPWIGPTLVLIGGFLGAVALSLPPKEGRPVAAMFPPWWGMTDAFVAAASAGGVVVRNGAWPALIVTASPEPDFNTRLREAGAWFVFDAGAFGGCAGKVE